MKKTLKILLIAFLFICTGYYLFFVPSGGVNNILEKNNEYALTFEKEEDFSYDKSSELENRYNKNYNLSKISLEREGVKEISGIDFVDSKILITDTKTDRLMMFDKKFNLIKSIGKTGNGRLEFIKPSNVKYANGYIYVLDYGNQRIQVLDKNLSYIKEYIFEKADESPEFIYSSMAVDNKENIYLSGDTTHTRSIQKIEKNGKVSYILDNFSGNVYFYRGILHAINWGQFLVNRKGEIICTTGRTFLLRKDENKLKKIYEFNARLTTEAFCMDDKIIYILSSTFRELMRFDRNTGAYIDSIGNYKSDKVYYNARMEVNNGVAYVTLGTNEVFIYNEK